MLTSALKALVKNPVKESFNFTFMKNEKIGRASCRERV